MIKFIRPKRWSTEWRKDESAAWEETENRDEDRERKNWKKKTEEGLRNKTYKCRLKRRSSCGDELQIDGSPWISRRRSWKWRRREGYLRGQELCWRTVKRRRCGWFDSRWRARRRRTTDHDRERRTNDSKWRNARNEKNNDQSTEESISSRIISKKEENISLFEGDTVVWSDDMNDNKKVERFVGTTREIRFLIPTDFYWRRRRAQRVFLNDYSATTTIMKEEKNIKRRGAYRKGKAAYDGREWPYDKKRKRIDIFRILRWQKTLFLRRYKAKTCAYAAEASERYDILRRRHTAAGNIISLGPTRTKAEECLESGPRGLLEAENEEAQDRGKCLSLPTTYDMIYCPHDRWWFTEGRI